MEGLYVRGQRAVFRPTGAAIIETMIVMMRDAMIECQRAGVVVLLVDTRSLSHAPLTTSDYFRFGHEIGVGWDRSIRLGILARPDQQDREAFAATVARDRGLRV